MPVGVRRVRDSCGMNVAGKARAYWSLAPTICR